VYDLKCKMSGTICYFCQYQPRYKTATEDHLRSHTKEKPFRCMVENCCSSFVVQSCLDRHCKKVHNILKFRRGQRNSSECYFCSSVLRCNADLANHMLCHTRERPYKCIYTKCKQFSSSNGARKMHALMCNYNPNLKINIQKRQEFFSKVLIEGRFKCYFCFKNFKEKRYFFNHIQKHTGELSVSCFGCKIEFNYRDLWKHQKVSATKTYSQSTVTVNLRSEAQNRRFLSDWP